MPRGEFPNIKPIYLTLFSMGSGITSHSILQQLKPCFLICVEKDCKMLRASAAYSYSYPVLESSDPATSRWVFRAKVFKSRARKGFISFGDANPSNVSALVRGAEMRMAETRAVDRA
jgi:hypothetical protein